MHARCCFCVWPLLCRPHLVVNINQAMLLRMMSERLITPEAQVCSRDCTATVVVLAFMWKALALPEALGRRFAAARQGELAGVTRLRQRRSFSRIDTLSFHFHILVMPLHQRLCMRDKQCSALTSPTLHAFGCARPSRACFGQSKSWPYIATLCRTLLVMPLRAGGPLPEASAGQ